MDKSQKMRIHLVNYEIGIKDGILSKYARQMGFILTDMGHAVSISNKPNPKAKVNHHINYLSYKKCPKTINTLMITHFTEGTKEKIEFAKKAMETADYGICFSQDVVDLLESNGIKNLTVIPPATEIVRRPRMIAIMTDLYPDGRKREWMFEELVKVIDKKKFVFSIVGDGGWRPILEKLIKLGLQVQWQPVYNPQLGQTILNIADFLLYTGGENCQAQSVIDAIKAGVRVIAPDSECYNGLDIEYKFKDQTELNMIFKSLETTPVDDWTWENYCKKHLEIWETLQKKR